MPTQPNHNDTQENSASIRIRELSERAEKGGYILVRSAFPRYEWKLLGSDYRDDLFTTTDLDLIEKWLDT